MDIIRGLVQNLIVIMLLTVFLEMLLPAGSLKKYVKMVMGLLIIIAVVQTAGDILRIDRISELPLLIETERKTDLNNILLSGRKLTEEQQKIAIEQYKKGIVSQILVFARNNNVELLDAEVVVQTEQNLHGYGLIDKVGLKLNREKMMGEDKVEQVIVQMGEGEKNWLQVDETCPEQKNLTNLINNLCSIYSLSPSQIKVTYQ